jgi:hypothetical protein
MKVESINNEGYALYDKGENVYLKIDTVQPDENEWDGEVQKQLKMVFASRSQHGDTEGRIQYYPNSLITIAETAEHTSHLGQLLKEAGVVEGVLKELGLNEETVESVLKGQTRIEAETDDDNTELAKVVYSFLEAKVFRASTKPNSEDDPAYSLVKEVFEAVDSADVDSAQEESESEEKETIFEEEDEDE